MKRHWVRAAGWWMGGLLVIAATVATLAAIAYTKYRQVEAAMAAPPPPEAPIAVGLATAESISFRPSSVVVGTILAPRFIQLRTELSGMVTQLSMEPGQVVREKQVLVQLDVRSENAELKSATAALSLANAELARLRSLANSTNSAGNSNNNAGNSSIVSAQEMDRALASAIQAEAEVERLTVLIDRKTIRAPFDARVGLHQLHVGQYLDAGTQITTLEGIDPYFDVDFSVPKHIAETLEIGAVVRLNLGSNNATGTPQVLEVPVTALDAKADAISRTMLVRARIDNPPPTMRPNDSIRIVVEYGNPISAVAVPATAVRSAPTGRSLFVAKEQNGQLRAELRNVTLIGTGDGTRAWIVSGVQIGEQVVAEGSFKVREGALLASVPVDRASSPIKTPDTALTSEAELP
ncbi:MAG: efflux RND transporter periplasmic adaptor subunit [Planctomycetaceae bacterium]|nr:efflux RND transporter periplasmic adaptor subunit [Planctomycetaceae bacterium]